LPELHPSKNLAGTAAATSILRKFDTNTEAATAHQSIMFIASATASLDQFSDEPGEQFSYEADMKGSK
jgi:hypothetical protein